MKPRAHFEQRTNSSENLSSALGRVGDSRKDLQQGALAGSVSSNDPDHVTMLDLKGQVLDCPNPILALRIPVRLTLERIGNALGQRVTQGSILLLLSDLIALTKSFSTNCDIAHWSNPVIGCVRGLYKIGKGGFHSTKIDHSTE